MYSKGGDIQILSSDRAIITVLHVPSQFIQIIRKSYVVGVGVGVHHNLSLGSLYGRELMSVNSIN